MKRDGLLNRDIVFEVAALGHTELLCVADCGLPIPKGVRVIDIAITAGNPSFLEVLDAILDELVVESVILAEEIDKRNGDLAKEINARFKGKPISKVPHEEFKAMTEKAKCIIRTGENTSFANAIIIGGVNF